MTTPGDIKIRLALEGAQDVQAGADRAAAAVQRFGASTQTAGRQTQLSGQQMAQVSAQLQDLFTQIQAGGSPITALLQQGSQLSGVFGGVGNALRAVGSLITPTVAAFGALGAAVTSSALAYAQGSAEADAYRRAIVLTGNAAGVTVGQLQDMARAQANLAGTQARAAEVLALLASSGNVARAQLQGAADAAIRLERAGGPAAEETAKKFAELGKSPVQALIKLNEAENFLTESVYRQVKALQDQGRTAEAAAVAQTAYATETQRRAQTLTENLGALERAWNGIKDKAKGAWDAMLNIGREDTVADRIGKVKQQLAEAQAKLEEARAGRSRLPGLDTNRIADAEQRRVNGLMAELKYLELTVAQEVRRTAAQREATEAVKATIEADKGSAKSLRDALNQREEEAALLERLSGLSGTYARDLKNLQDVRQRGVVTEAQYVQLVEELIAKQPFAVEQAKAQADAHKQVADAMARGNALYEQYLESLNRSAASAAQRVQQLQDEAAASALAATGQMSLARAIEQVAIARLEDQKRAAGGDSAAVAAIQREIDKRKELIGLLGGKEARDAAAEANKELDKLFDPDRAQSFGDALSGAFAQAGSSLGQLSSALQAYGRSQEALAARQAVINAASDPAKKMREQLKLNEASQRANVALYANMAGAAKGFFKEGTQGYKALEVAENAWRAYQLASDLVKGASAAAVAVANQAQGDPYTAWARMAAMAAAMASLGFVVSGGLSGGPTTGGDGGKVATGQGTVFGDAEAKSESIARSIDRLSDTAALQLTAQSGMLAALRNIENSIGGITNLVLRGQTAGDAAARLGIQESSGYSSRNLNLSFGAISSPLNELGKAIPIIGKINNALFGTKTSVSASGLFAGPQSLASVLVGGLSLKDFADVNQSKKFFGIKYSNKNSTQYQDADPVLQQQFGLVFKGFYDAILAASDPLDVALEQVSGRLNAFVVDIGKIDLKGLTGEQIQEKLAAVLGAAGDSIAQAAIPGLEAFQVVGEGYFETLVRVASGVETATAALDLLGISAVNYTAIARKQGDVAAEIVRESLRRAETRLDTFTSASGQRTQVPVVSSVGELVNQLDGSAEDILAAYQALVGVRDVLIAVGESGDSLTAAMIRGAGGLDKLQASLSSYFEEFYSEAERTAAGKASLQSQFDKLGLGALPETRAAFRALVEGVDTSTEAGQKLYAQLVGLSGAFAQLVPAVASLADTTAETLRRLNQSYADARGQLEIDLLRAQGNEAGARERERAAQLARDTAGLSAEQAAAIAVLYDYNQALRDQAVAARAAIDAQKAIETAFQRSSATLADARADLEQQLLVASGQDAEAAARARQRDLARLTAGLGADQAAQVTAAYDYNEALRQQIQATQLAAQETQRAAEQQAQAAQEAQQAAEQFKSAWQSVTDTLFDEAARIRGLLGQGGAGESLASAQARFAITTAQARAGDQDAARLLPGLSQTLLELAEQSAGSLLDLQRIRAQVAASLEQTGAGLAGRFGLQVPKLATGTNLVPRDMLALLHEGEAVVPRAYNPAAGGAGADGGAVTAELRALREENRAQALALVRLQTEMNKLLKRWDVDGLPEERAVSA